MASCHVDFELSMIPRNGGTNHDCLWHQVKKKMWRIFSRDRHWKTEM